MSESSPPLKCPFRATLITRSFGCLHAEEITRREGPDIGCKSNSANALCVEFYTQLKSIALSELGYEDDLTTMPASVLQKIQFGGLLGLNNEVHATSGSELIDNIFELLESAKRKHGEVINFPYVECIAAIKTYKIKRRRDR
ncbi:hypothetical protein [Kaarinaea lacus]